MDFPPFAMVYHKRAKSPSHAGPRQLYNYNARLYDSESGRFVTPDTIVPDPANPQSLNRFSYALNNPIRLFDPTGNYTEYCDDEGNWHAELDEVTVRPNTGIEPAGFFASVTNSVADWFSSSDSFEYNPELDSYSSLRGKLYGEITAPSSLPIRILDYFNTDIHSILGRGPASRIDIFMKYVPFVVSAGETGLLKLGGLSTVKAGVGFTEKLLWAEASKLQMEEAGKAIAGFGSKSILRNAPRLVSQYGGNIDDWAKMTSSAFRTSTGGSFQTHWYENISNGLRVEYKTIIQYLNR